MSFNTFGHMFRVTTFGESHGPAIGCVVDGCPPGIPLTEADIQPYLDQRRPGQSRFTTQRREPDEVKILSGVFDDVRGVQVTTGTPIGLLIQNTDQRSKDYSDIKDSYRPGHADFSYDIKYGIRDYRGGGRQSARETAMRVAAGAIARKIVPGMTVRAALIQIGEHKVDRARWDWDEVATQSVLLSRCARRRSISRPTSTTIRKTRLLGRRRHRGGGGRRAAGLGAPIYGKLDGDLAAALMGINAVKGVEIGAGFAAAVLSGEDNADEMRMGNDGKPIFLSNHAGGILGGISTGQPMVCRFAVKPTSSILTPRRTVDRYGDETEIMTKGRHDPCVGIRAVPIGEAMVACVIADHYLRHRGQVGDGPHWPFERLDE